MLSLSFSDISQNLSSFHFPDIDAVVGIATGGTFPAILIAHQLAKPYHLLSINYRHPDNSPRYEAPQLLKEFSLPLPAHSKILLVDDVSVSGKTLEKARSLLESYSVTTFTLKGKADLVLFPDIKECVAWPWKTSPQDEAPKKQTP